MKKVHSSVWARLIDDVALPTRLRPVLRADTNPGNFEGFVVDGPFTESKEGCAHVAILARMTAFRRAVH
jgi:hypothetical protein